jgi:hypothetical protein
MLMNGQKAARYLFYSVWAVLMTALTYVLGAVSLKTLRRKFGRAGYWAVTVALTAVLFALQFKLLAVAFFSLVLLVGVFAELEEHHQSLNVSAFFTLVINSLVGAGAFILWVYSTGPKWSQVVLGWLEQLLKPLAEMNPHIEIKYFDLMLQLPSIILIMWMGALYLAVLLESRLLSEGDALPVDAQSMRKQLGEFKLPDACVWVFIVSLLGAFGNFGHHILEAIAANTLNVCFMLFFFQGVAVVAKFFEKMRLAPFWQTLLMALIVIHLFLFVSVLGLMDYWFDFRGRIAKGKGSEEFKEGI